MIWDPEEERVLSAGLSAVSYSPFAGMALTGRAKAVYLRGELAARDGQIVKEYGGRYLRAGAPKMIEIL